MASKWMSKPSFAAAVCAEIFSVAMAACTHCGKPARRRLRTCSEECARARQVAFTQPLRSKSRRARRAADKRARYRGSDKAQVIAKLTSAQDGCCAICDERTSLVLDHDHQSGRPRAMLCIRCNAAFGQMRESPQRIRRLLEYANKWSQLPTQRGLAVVRRDRSARDRPHQAPLPFDASM